MVVFIFESSYAIDYRISRHLTITSLISSMHAPKKNAIYAAEIRTFVLHSGCVCFSEKTDDEAMK